MSCWRGEEEGEEEEEEEERLGTLLFPKRTSNHANFYENKNVII